VRIDGLGTPNLPIAPASGSGAIANAQPQTTAAQAIQQALQQEEQKGGGGGGHGGHGVKKGALDSIDEIAARASLNIEDRKKSMLDRMRDIEKLKEEMALADQEVGEKEPGERDGSEDPEPEDDGNTG
jgi:hypothetical protein